MLTAAEAAPHMAQALRLAAAGLYTTHPNPRVGCVVVKDGRVIGEGAHLRAGEPHAEIFALQAAGDAVRNADVFVTLEPCAHFGRTPPCTDALIAAGPRKVWVAMIDPNPLVAGRGITRLREAGIDVDLGLMSGAAEALNRGFVSRMMRGRPWLTLKLAASLDGRTAMASGQSQWITGAAARADVHRLRAAAGAVLSGVGTVLADDPQLNVRGFDAKLRQPDRIVLDSDARTPATARVWAPGARRLWLGATPPATLPDGVEWIAVPRAADGGLALDQVLEQLAQRQVNEVLVECGPRLAGAWLRSGLVDEVIAYLAPQLLGHEARPFALLPGLESLAQRIELRFIETRVVGDDLRLTLRPRPRG